MARSAQNQTQRQRPPAGKPTKGQRQDALERKRDERAVRNAYRKIKKEQSYLADDQNFASFATQLRAMGLQLRDIPGDGNCLFRALGDQLEGHGGDHMTHRLNVAQYMRDHKDDFEPFMEDNIPFDRYLSNLSKPGTYAGNDSIVAFARYNKVNVVIHQVNLPVWRVIGSDKHNTRELHISYHNGDHYSSVRKLGDNLQKGTNFRLGESSGSELKTKPKTNSKSQGSNGFSNGASEDAFSDLEFHIMDETGCQDLKLIRETLEDNDYDPDATIGFLLQLTCADSDSGPHDANGLDSGERSPQGAAGIWSPEGTASRIFGFPDDEEGGSGTSGSSSKTQPNRTGGKGGKAAQVNARQRKAQQRLEKKQRQTERHRQRIQGESYHSNTTNSSDEENSSIILVGEMGALSI